MGQFVWGAAQPVFGAIADRVGPVRVMMFGGLLMASDFGLVFALGVVAAAGVA